MTNEELTNHYYQYLADNIGTNSVLDFISINGGFDNFTRLDEETKTLKFEISFNDVITTEELEKYIISKDESTETK